VGLHGPGRDGPRSGRGGLARKPPVGIQEGGVEEGEAEVVPKLTPLLVEEGFRF